MKRKKKKNGLNWRRNGCRFRYGRGGHARLDYRMRNSIMENLTLLMGVYHVLFRVFTKNRNIIDIYATPDERPGVGYALGVWRVGKGWQWLAWPEHAVVAEVGLYLSRVA